jgi:hypothetical protein
MKCLLETRLWWPNAPSLRSTRGAGTSFDSARRGRRMGRSWHAKLVLTGRVGLDLSRGPVIHHSVVLANSNVIGDIMEALALLFTGIGVLAVLDVLAIRFGADSRDSIGDDHRRGAALRP